MVVLKCVKKVLGKRLTEGGDSTGNVRHFGGFLYRDGRACKKRGKRNQVATRPRGKEVLAEERVRKEYAKEEAGSYT